MTQHRINSQDTLSEKQQLLLSRYRDGECSWLAKLRARRLLTKSACARIFSADLEQLSHHLLEPHNLANDNLTHNRIESSAAASEPGVASIDLWERINVRLEQEQRAALYLGARRLEDSPRDPADLSWPLDASLWSRLNPRHALLGGLSGAAIASVLLLVVSRPSQLVTFSAPVTGPAAHNQLVQPVGIGTSTASANRYQPPSSVRPFHSLEVDWMRASGSLKLIPDPTGSSAIIWVRRRTESPPSRSVAPRLRPTPLGLAPQRYSLDAGSEIGAK